MYYKVYKMFTLLQKSIYKQILINNIHIGKVIGTRKILVKHKIAVIVESQNVFTGVRH